MASVMFGKKGLIRSSMVTVARELKAEEIVLVGKIFYIYIRTIHMIYIYNESPMVLTTTPIIPAIQYIV